MSCELFFLVDYGIIGKVEVGIVYIIKIILESILESLFVREKVIIVKLF